MRVVFRFALPAVLATSVADAQAPLQGLLEMPRLFGAGACDPAPPEPVPLHAAPHGTRVGEIRVHTPYRALPEGGCRPVVVRVVRGGREDSLPTREVAYEVPAAIVTARVDGWSRVRLGAAEVWIADSTSGRYVPYETLVREGLAYVTDVAPASLRTAPAGVGGARIAADASVRVLDSRRVRDALWFEVAVLRGSPCGDDADPPVVARGWVPAHDARGEPTVWFNSRGC
jgi:hypothetical protein